MATIVDSYSEANYDAGANLQVVHPSAVTNTSISGQSFTGDGQKIGSCKFYLKKEGSPGAMAALLYSHTGTFGVSSLPHTHLATSNTYEATDVLGTDFALFELKGFVGYTLVNGTKYCILLRAMSGTWDASNRVILGRDTSSPTHGGNYIYFTLGTYKYYAPHNLCFYVLGVVPAVGRSIGLVMG